MDRLHLLDSLVGLVFLYVSANLPFSVFFLRGFFAGIPREYEEAFRLDGASTLEVSCGSSPRCRYRRWQWCPCSLSASPGTSSPSLSRCCPHRRISLCRSACRLHRCAHHGVGAVLRRLGDRHRPGRDRRPGVPALGPQRDLARGPTLSRLAELRAFYRSGQEIVLDQLPEGTGSVVARRARAMSSTPSTTGPPVSAACRAARIRSRPWATTGPCWPRS